MARIFFALASFAGLLLLANVLVGFYLGDMGQSARRYEQARQAAHELESNASPLNDAVIAARTEKDRELQSLGDMRRNFQPHIWLGIAAALVTVLVNCISVTYFIGTSRWCREVVDAYRLREEFAQRSRRLKRRSFPFALIGLLTMVGIVALGAAADPGASLASPASWVMIHMTAALLGTVVIGVAFWFQALAVGANLEVINEIVHEVERIRALPRDSAEPVEVDASSHAVT